MKVEWMIIVKGLWYLLCAAIGMWLGLQFYPHIHNWTRWYLYAASHDVLRQQRRCIKCYKTQDEITGSCGKVVMDEDFLNAINERLAREKLAQESTIAEGGKNNAV